MKFYSSICFLLSLCAIHPVFSQSSTRDLNQEKINKNLKILVLSDLNDGYGSTTYSQEVLDVVDRIAELKPDLILCGGDMVAGQKKL